MPLFYRPSSRSLPWWLAAAAARPTTPTSGAKNRAFISNTFTGNLQIVDTQNDTTPLTAQTTNNQGQLIPGPTGNDSRLQHDVTFEVESPDHTVTMVYDPTTLCDLVRYEFLGDDGWRGSAQQLHEHGFVFARQRHHLRA